MRHYYLHVLKAIAVVLIGAICANCGVKRGGNASFGSLALLDVSAQKEGKEVGTQLIVKTDIQEDTEGIKRVNKVKAQGEIKQVFLSGTQTLYQALMTQENTTYIISNDYIIIEDIIIPNNSILEFHGGRITGNHTIKGQNTRIKAGPAQIFDGVKFEGSFCNDITYFSWFTHSKNNNTEELLSLFTLSDGIVYTDVYLEEGVFYINGFDAVNNSAYVCRLPNNAYIHNLASIQILPTHNKSSIPIYGKYNNNVTWDGGKIVGCMDSYRKTHPGTQGHWGFHFRGCENITIKNVTFSNHLSDGIELNIGVERWVHNKNIIIENVFCDHNGRQGISIEDGENIIVRNSTFSNTGVPFGTPPMCGIDIEPTYEQAIFNNIVIENCEFVKNQGHAINIQGTGGDVNVKNVVSDGSICAQGQVSEKGVITIKGSRFTALVLSNYKNVMVDSCSFTNIYQHKTYNKKLTINHSRIEYNHPSIYQAALYFDGVQGEEDVTIKKCTIKVPYVPWFSSTIDIKCENCSIDVGHNDLENWITIPSHLTGCTINSVGKMLLLTNRTNKKGKIVDSQIYLHNKGATYSGQHVPLRIQDNGEYEILNSKIIIDETLGDNTVKPYYTVNKASLLIDNSVISNITRGIEASPVLDVKYSDGFSVLENKKKISRVGNKWVDGTGEVYAWDVITNLTNLNLSTKKSADNGSSYKTRIVAIDGYKIPSSINISIGGIKLKEGREYSYNPSNGELVVNGIDGKGGVTYNLVITAAGVADQH